MGEATMKLDLGAHTDTGKVREKNEDSYGFAETPNVCLFVVCDGMGGHAGGQIASRVACSTIVQEVMKAEMDDPRELLYRAVEAAHRAVLQEAKKLPEVKGMGTTAVVGLIQRNNLYLGHVGDSRAYRIRRGQQKQLTTDQTRVQRMVEQGILSEAEAKTHPDAGVLVQAIGQEKGIKPFVTPEETGIALEKGDVIVLCSDGVYDCTGDGEIAEMVGGRDAADAARHVVRVTTERDGKDNATAVVVRIDPDSRNKSRVTQLDEPVSKSVPPPGRPSTPVRDAEVAAAVHPAQFVSAPPPVEHERRPAGVPFLAFGAVTLAALLFGTLLGLGTYHLARGPLDLATGGSASAPVVTSVVPSASVAPIAPTTIDDASVLDSPGEAASADPPRVTQPSTAASAPPPRQPRRGPPSGGTPSSSARGTTPQPASSGSGTRPGQRPHAAGAGSAPALGGGSKR